jgi:xylulose-5-phosphate/fructose-6-phosphate phosphoketolase
VNVVDLMTLQTPGEHPHGISDRDFDSMFTTDRPVIFAYHGYPTLIHRLTYRRKNHNNLHVHGYKEEGTTTTPFDMTVLNELDRFHLAGDAVDRVQRLQRTSAHFQQHLRNKLFEHKQYIYEHGDELEMALPPRSRVTTAHEDPRTELGIKQSKKLALSVAQTNTGYTCQS